MIAEEPKEKVNGYQILLEKKIKQNEDKQRKEEENKQKAFIQKDEEFPAFDKPKPQKRQL